MTCLKSVCGQGLLKTQLRTALLQKTSCRIVSAAHAHQVPIFRHAGAYCLQPAPGFRSLSSSEWNKQNLDNWISKIVPMARKAFSWDISVDTERLWFSFKDQGAQELLARFRTAADSDFGGQSHCTLELTDRGTALFSGELSLALAHTRVNYEGQIRHTQEGGSKDKAAPDLKKKVAAWITGERPRTAKGGFVALSSLPHALDRDIDDFNTLNLRVKSDGRMYFVNLKTEALPLEAVYQAVLVPKKKGEWEDVQIKASDFVLTHAGLVNVDRVQMNWRSIKTFGISLMDRQDGPFRLEIESVTVVRLDGVDGTDSM